jgi:flagellar protein FlbD
MIVVTGLNNRQWAVNPDLIERMHESPDTTLIMIDGATHVIKERMYELIDMIVAFRARVLATARDLPEISPEQGGRTLSIVPSNEDRPRNQ